MKEKFILTIFLFLILISAQEIFALTAESIDYSVARFGTGIQASDLSSDNLEAHSVLLANAGTRNAENSQFTTNIGFWGNASYYTSVSITSYSISPSPATIGSTVGLSISALNAQSVWAKITAPNSQEQILVLINNQVVNYLPSPSLLGRYSVIFYANSSSGAVASAIGYFDLTEPTTNPSSGSTGGGGRTTTIIEKCVYNWDCTPWSICSEGKQKRVCKNIGTCDGTESKPIEEMPCSETLFDIALKLKEINLTQNKTLKFGVELTEKMNAEKIDIHIKYSIIDSNNTEIFSQIETRAIEGSLTYEKEINEIKLKGGEYILRVDALYGNLQRAFAEQRFKVGEENIGEGTGKPIINVKKIIGFLKVNYSILILFITLVLSSSLFIFRKGHLLRKSGEIIKNNKKYFVYGLSILLAGVSLTMLNKFGGITGETINTALFSNKGRILISLIIFALVLLILFSKKIIRFLLEKREDSHKTQKNSIKGLISKQVYSESGNYVGKISEVILGENKIENLKIKIRKKHKLKAKGIIVNYKNIKSIGEIALIDKQVYEELEK